MKNKALLFLGIFWGQIGYSQTLSPEVFTTSGDYFSNLSNSLSWTLGECVIDTYTGSSNILTQGFQQSSYLINSLEENLNSEHSIFIYPNPTSGLITIYQESKDTKQLQVDLLDINCKLLYSEMFQNDIQLNLSRYTNSQYFIRVKDTNKNSIKTFKLIKTN